jgi:1,4-dihydroxy-2-naphthoate polyprenyltransferase
MSTQVQAWLLAIRPKTLSAAAAPVLVGTALAVRDGCFHPLAALAALVGAMLIQIGTNLLNDVDDFERGADTHERLGPIRVTQSGLLSASDVRRAGWGAFAAAAAAGLYLIACAGWPILVVGIAAIVSAWAYTGGPWPLGYNGLGDLFVFLFFGFAAVAGTYYVQALAVTGTVWTATLPAGALATAILVVNNVRDTDTDRAAGKRTLAVRLGQRAGRLEHAALVAIAYAVPLFLWATGSASAWVLLPWLSLPLAWALVRDVTTITEGPAFNVALHHTARLHLVFGVLFAVGLLGG